MACAITPHSPTAASTSASTQTVQLAQPLEAASHYAFTPELWIVTSYFNPNRYRSKRLNYERFRSPIEAAGLHLLTVECALEGADFELEAGRDVLQLRAVDVLWQKERLLNLAMAQLPPQAQKIAWLDCDVLFCNPNWAVETALLLDQFPLVQCFSTAVRLEQGQTAYHGQAELVSQSFAAVLQENTALLRQGNAHRHGHTGYAWAGRRDLLQKHGLYDAMICGAADHLMAHAVCGDFAGPCIRRHLGHNTPQLRHFMDWGKPVFAEVKGRVGAVPGTLLHLWHGSLSNRRYVERHDVLAQHGFDPRTDIAVDDNGTWRWNSDKPLLHDWLRQYFAQRQEDP